jgi:hypothetical protein
VRASLSSRGCVGSWGEQWILSQILQRQDTSIILDINPTGTFEIGILGARLIVGTLKTIAQRSLIHRVLEVTY